MSDRPDDRSPPLFNIAAVERETRIGKDTLRAWERRYGFPRPQRDANGDRLYSLDQLDQLRDLRRLLDAGHRPGRVVPMDAAARRSLGLGQVVGTGPGRQAPAADPAAGSDPVIELLQAVRCHDPAQLRSMLNRAMLRQGLGRFVVATAVPLLQAVGEAWAGGSMAVFEEHLCSEVLVSTLRSALSSVVEPPAGNRPRVLLATLQGETHSLAPLLAGALFALEGCVCTLLGCETPTTDVVRAAAAVRADIVSISFSAARTAPQVLRMLTDLRAALPPITQVWAGSPLRLLQRRRVDGVLVFDRLERIGPQVADWRRTLGPSRQEVAA